MLLLSSAPPALIPTNPFPSDSRMQWQVGWPRQAPRTPPQRVDRGLEPDANGLGPAVGSTMLAEGLAFVSPVGRTGAGEPFEVGTSRDRRVG
ncbi:hypothetical protein DB30_05979 [Enhygromyxa salina]|uniref:Uncharacterized protein n=1 Tax=Enhygromyxa salina TaxID=215803 RepID=A0A0C2DC98_9BACT|nr:hypothetical protein [Enhygromyxa salina]KIG19075.1 hypothetical protein DB30_05979 [Enhygromyxa salina]